MKTIEKEESSHFVFSRILNFALTLLFIFVTSMTFGRIHTQTLVPPEVAYLIFAAFLLYCIGSTLFNGYKLQKLHKFKEENSYCYDKNDIRYDDN
mmetsp:Transcript_13221/g.13040  ORF Transcript_13221/g.13040 Transcript_13221/m.13040 type:complete len:95 (-) Transcript_13221:423-707(-)